MTEKPYHYHEDYSCPAGSYCINSVETKCDEGFWQPVVGADSQDACMSIPAGWYGETSGLTNYIEFECDEGYYCPEESTMAAEETCPEGFFRKNKLAGSDADCGSCPAGKFCPEQTIEPFTCPLGYYCPPETVIPIPCPRGKFGHSVGLRDAESCDCCWGGRYCS